MEFLLLLFLFSTENRIKHHKNDDTIACLLMQYTAAHLDTSISCGRESKIMHTTWKKKVDGQIEDDVEC